MMTRKTIVVCVVVVLVGVLAATMAGCPRQQESSAVGPSHRSPRPASGTTIEQIGSTTVLPLAQKWQQEFNKEHPSVELAVSGGGSGTGIKALINGTADVANASRAIKEEEKQAAKQAGVNPVEHVVAYDGIAVIVHPSNPVDRLSVEQLSRIFSGQITNWSAVGGVDKQIVLLNRDSSSGTYEAFKEIVVQLHKSREDRDYAAQALAVQSNQAVLASVTRSEATIGYCGLGYLGPKVKAVAVSPMDGGEAVKPSIATVNDGSYPISRSLYMYTDGQPSGVVADYFEFVKGPGQKFVEELGYVPLAK